MNDRNSKFLRKLRQPTTLILSALAIVLVTACAQASDPAITADRTESTDQSRQQATAPEESTPLPASTAIDSNPTLVPAATFATIEAKPNDPTPLPDRSASEAKEPDTSGQPPILDTVPTPLPDRSASEAEGPETSTQPATPSSNPTPVQNPTVTTPSVTPTTGAPENVPLAPTPRPTPGTISRRTQFVPLDEPKYVTRENASANITNGSFVLGVVSNGEARAYPLDMMWYHHIANDTVGGEPWLITY
jgi:hypothetical protein